MKKLLICGLIGVICSAVLVFLDVKFVQYVFSVIPQSVGQWMGLLKIAIVFMDIWLTFGICAIPFFLSMGLYQAIED